MKLLTARPHLTSKSGNNPSPDSTPIKNDNSTAKSSDDSDGIMGGGLPDPHPA